MEQEMKNRLLNSGAREPVDSMSVKKFNGNIFVWSHTTYSFTSLNQNKWCLQNTAHYSIRIRKFESNFKGNFPVLKTRINPWVKKIKFANQSLYQFLN